MTFTAKDLSCLSKSVSLSFSGLTVIVMHLATTGKIMAEGMAHMTMVAVPPGHARLLLCSPPMLDAFVHDVQADPTD